jgi:hypothetical protein
VSSESQIIKNIDVRLIASGRARDADGGFQRESIIPFMKLNIMTSPRPARYRKGVATLVIRIK